jgi:hypothetical protein
VTGIPATCTVPAGTVSCIINNTLDGVVTDGSGAFTADYATHYLWVECNQTFTVEATDGTRSASDEFSTADVGCLSF